MTKKKNKRHQRPSRREAERMEQSGQHPSKKHKPNPADDQPFMQMTKKGAPPTASHKNGGSNGSHGQQSSSKKNKKQQQSPSSPQFAPSSSSSTSSSGPNKKSGKKSAGAAAVPADEYTSTRLDGFALANGTDPAISEDGIELDSMLTSKLFFEWLIYPMSIASFYSEYFEKKPLYISRKDIDAKIAKATLVTTKQTLEEMLPAEGEGPHMLKGVSTKPAALSTNYYKTKENALKTEIVTVVDVSSTASSESTPTAAAAAASSSSSSSPSHYYSNWFSISDVFALLRDDNLNIKYREDVDITKYKNGVRSTLNPQGRATESEVKKFIADDCSLRFLCPQKYSDRLWKMLARLDEFFGMQTGANSYYTPKGTQGFAPHYDDVDIFVIQTEGSKRWRLYPPRAPSEILPNHSSPNYSQDEIGSPVMDVLLHAGDFLYAPRGTIHQCVASVEEPSLHVTLSTCLQTNWQQYLSILLPRALQLASEERIDFRRSLPPAYEYYMGVMNSDSTASGGRREQFMDQTLGLLTEMMDLDMLPFDAAADQMATDFMHGRVPCPPPSSEQQKKRTIHGQSEGDKQPTKKKSLFKPTTCVRLVRGGIARITTTSKGDLVSLHHILQNSRCYKDKPLAEIEYPIGYAETLEVLCKSYPTYVQLQQLPLPEADMPTDEEHEIDAEAAQDDLFELIEQLFDEGLLEVCQDINQIPEQFRYSGEEEEGEDGEEFDQEEDGEEQEDEEGEDQEMEMGEDEEDADPDE